MIIVLGASGQLGTELLSACDDLALAHVGLTHADIEVENLASISTALAKYAGMDNLTVINTAAFHNVDACEKDGDRAFQVNCVGSQNVAQWCRQHGAKYVYISTDYCQAGTELPVSVYAKSKLAGELAALCVCPDALVVRAGTLYGFVGPKGKPDRKNFIDVVVEKIKSQEPFDLPAYTSIVPTSAKNAAAKILKHLHYSGVVYAVDSYAARSHYDLGCWLALHLELPSRIRAVSYDPNDTIRPHKIDYQGDHFPSRPDGDDPIHEYLIEKGYIA